MKVCLRSYLSYPEGSESIRTAPRRTRADEFIPEGTLVWRYHPGLDMEFEPDFVRSLPEPARERFERYTYLDPVTDLYVLCWDDARFMNHSDRPNTRSDRTIDPVHGVDLAAHDIERGVELTTDYRTFDAEAEQYVEEFDRRPS